MLAAHPQLQLRDAAGRPVRGAIDIGQPASAEIVDELLKEYAELFPGAYWHLGGDEYQALVRRNPEASFPQLAALARQKYGPQARVQDLATAWVNDRAAVVRPLGKKPKAWNDGFFRGGVVRADKDLEVEYWTGKEIGARPPLEYLREGRMAGQRQRRVPVLRARPAADLRLSDGPPDLRAVDTVRDPRHPAGAP